MKYFIASLLFTLIINLNLFSMDFTPVYSKSDKSAEFVEVVIIPINEVKNDVSIYINYENKLSFMEHLVILRNTQETAEFADYLCDLVIKNKSNKSLDDIIYNELTEQELNIIITHYN